MGTRVNRNGGIKEVMIESSNMNETPICKDQIANLNNMKLN